MSVTASDPIRTLLASDDPVKLRQGLALVREELARLEANLADRNTGVRAKAIRSLGKMARQGHLRPTERDVFRKACHLIVGDDEAFDWDRAFVIRREAEEALRYL